MRFSLCKVSLFDFERASLIFLHFLSLLNVAFNCVKINIISDIITHHDRRDAKENFRPP